MKLTINTVKLQEMVLKAVKGAGNNKLIPITNLMCISGKKGKLTLITTNATNYLYIVEDKAYVEKEDFYVTVQVEQFSKLVSKMTSKDTTLEVKGNSLEVIGNGKYTIALLLDENGELIKYPDPYTAPKKADFTDTIELTTVKTILESIKPSLSVTMELPCITGYLAGDSVIATDAFKAASYGKRLFHDQDVLISAELMNLLDVMTDPTINVLVKGDNLSFVTKNCIIYSHAMAGIEEYPIEEIQSLLTEEFESSCKVNKQDFLTLLDRISLFVGEYDDQVVKLEFGQDGVTVSNLDANSNEFIEYISSKNFQPFECLTDIEMLMTQIKAYAPDAVEIQYGNDSSIKFVDGEIVQALCLCNETEE